MVMCHSIGLYELVFIVVDVHVVGGRGIYFTSYIELESVAWDATGGCW